MQIRKVDNGFVIELPGDEDEAPAVEVIEEFDAPSDAEFFGTGDEGKIAVGKLLMRVAEYFGVPYNKFSDANVHVSFDRKGHKLEE